jgi:arylsulfatase A-like enzyme
VQPPGLLRALDLLVDVFGEPLPLAGLEFLRENAFEGGADNSPLRGGKMSVLEGGTRVPAAIWWPGHLEAGRSELFVTVQDVLPTLLDAAGLAAAIPADLDGTSRLAALAAGDERAEHPDYLVQGLDGKALYHGPWKLILPESPLPFFESPAQLYRFEQDPLEANDVADAHPDVVRELTASVAAWPEGPTVHGSIARVMVRPDGFGGEEFLPPWAEAAK